MYQSDGRVRWPVKLWYAAGQTGQSVTDFGFGTLAFIYYNQVLGLSGSYTGLGVAIALFFDALVDPAVGSWSDGFQSKWGRRHLFMAAAIVPLGLLFFGLFWPPEGLGQMQLFLWFTLFSVLVRTALTFFNVPFLSLGAELSQDYSERTQIVAVRIAVGVFVDPRRHGRRVEFLLRRHSGESDAATHARAVLLVRDRVGGVDDSGARGLDALYRAFDSASGRLAAAAARFRHRQVYRDLREALGNDSFRVLFVGTLIYFIYAGTQGALWMHLMTFYWQLDTKGIQWIQYAGLIGAICGIPLAPQFNRWFDKKWTVVVGVSVGALADTVPVLRNCSMRCRTTPRRSSTF